MTEDFGSHQQTASQPTDRRFPLRRTLVICLYLTMLFAAAWYGYSAASIAVCERSLSCFEIVQEIQIYLLFIVIVLCWSIITRGAEGRLYGALGRSEPRPRPMTWESWRAHSLGALSTVFAVLLVKELVEIISAFILAGPLLLIEGDERVWLRVAVLAVILYFLFAICGVALCRLTLRVLPPRAARGVRFAGLGVVTLATGWYLYQTFYVDLVDQMSEALGIPVSELDPAQVFMFKAIPLAIVAILVGAYVSFAERHLRPANFLRRPFVLFLRRFSTVGDRAGVLAAMRSRPPGHRIALLTPGHSRLRDWDARLIALTGLSLVNPLGSIPVFLGERDAEWRETVERGIAKARLIIFEASDDSEAMRFEADTITSLGRWEDTIVLKEVGRTRSAEMPDTDFPTLRSPAVVPPHLSAVLRVEGGPSVNGQADREKPGGGKEEILSAPTLWPSGNATSQLPHAIILYTRRWTVLTVAGALFMTLLSSMIALGFFMRLFWPGMPNAAGLLPITGIPVALFTTFVFCLVAAASFFHPVMDREAKRTLRRVANHLSMADRENLGRSVTRPAIALVAVSAVWVVIAPEAMVMAVTTACFALLCILADRQGQTRWMRPLGFVLLAALAVVATPPPIGIAVERDLSWWAACSAVGVAMAVLLGALTALVRTSREKGAGPVSRS